MRLRCPDNVSGDLQEDEIPGGSLSLNVPIQLRVRLASTLPGP